MLASNAYSRDRSLPAELETIGDRLVGLNNGGVADPLGAGAVRINPAHLALEKSYKLSASYIWPGRGRNLYQIGVVDATSSTLAAGLLYTGFNDPYRSDDFLLRKDTPVNKRISLGFAYALSRLALGLSGNYVELNQEEAFSLVKTNRISLSLGLLFAWSESVRVGVSIENLRNEGIESVAPLTYRLGLSWNPVESDFQMYFDYKRRERIAALEGPLRLPEGVEANASDLFGYTSAEQMLILGLSYKFWSLLRPQISYAKAVSADNRESLAASLILEQDAFNFSYSWSKPYMKRKEQVSSLSLEMLLKI